MSWVRVPAGPPRKEVDHDSGGLFSLVGFRRLSAGSLCLCYDESMKAPELQTTATAIRLIEPNVERDAQLGHLWLAAEDGRRTLSLMGVADKDNRATTLDEERSRVEGFIENPDQLNWMIELDGRVVGSVWVDLEPKHTVPAPAVHIMIGDPTARGKGVGRASLAAVIAYLQEQGEVAIYSRILVCNATAKNLLHDLGFAPDGQPYADQDGLEWQNLALRRLDT